MTKRILVIEDEPQMLLGLRDNLELEGYEVRDGGGRRRRAGQGHLDGARPGDPRHHAAAQERLRGLPRAARARQPDAGRHADRAIAGDRQGARPRARRRRLRHQAVLHHRAARARPRRAAPRRRTAVRPRDLPHRRHRDRLPAAPGASRRRSASTSRRASSTCCATSSRHTGQVVTREQILNQVWGYEESPTTRTIDNFVAKLRQKIERSPHEPEHILTVHGAGLQVRRLNHV